MEKKTTAQRLNELMNARSLKQVDILRMCQPYSAKYGVPINKNDLSQYCSGKVVPKQYKLAILARALNVNEVYLMGYDVPAERDALNTDMMKNVISSSLLPVKRKRFPMLGNIACGEPMYADEMHETYVEASSDIDADFCLRARGDSMIGAGIQNDDVVYIKRADIVSNGSLAAVIIGDEATLKYWDYDSVKQRLILTPANSAYRVQVYEGEDLNTVHCLGLVICSTHWYVTRK